MKMIRMSAIAAAMILAASCMNDVGYETTYTAGISFDNFGYGDDDIYGEDKLFFGSYLISDDIVFASKTDESVTDFNGFGLSKATSKDEIADGRYSVNAESASSGSAFALFHNTSYIEPLDQHIIFARAGYGTCSPVSCMVNNTKLVADMIQMYNSQNDESIGVTLTATGYAGGSETGKATISLAIPGETPEARDSIMSSWTLFDLSDLGNVEYISFNMEFSDATQTMIPQYFCLDDFVANVHVKIAAE